MCPFPLRLAAIAVGVLPLGVMLPGLGLPPPDDLPEEILRTEIILEARSPMNGAPLTAADYAELQEELQDVNDWQTVPADLANLIFLLRVRRVIRPILPILP